MFDKKILSGLESLETPYYFYDMGLLKRTLEQLVHEARRYNYHVHYAFKANSNDVLLSAIKNFGLGADCVSGNEIKKAIGIGFSVSDIVFEGPGKSDWEINLALDSGIFCINCESFQELGVINDLAAKKGKTANVGLRINPNVDANTHHYITTGLEENKFGINTWELDEIIIAFEKLKNLKLIGIHFHIGSQIPEINTFGNLCSRVNEIQTWFESKGIFVEHLNLGGGLGINYQDPDSALIPDFSNYFKIFNDQLKRRAHQKVHFELGRSVVAQCGSLISRVLFIKKGISKKFIVLDAGMTELIRPALYQSYHKIENISASGIEEEAYEVVGPICESSDCFGKNVILPETVRGDLIVLRSAGAYGEVMSSQYNLRSRAQSVYSDN